MIVDVAHTNEKSFWDIIETTSAPVIASHSNVRQICDVPRNLWDEQIDAIRQGGGMVGINAFNEFVSHSARNKPYPVWSIILTIWLSVWE